jgi:pSer/pThr/pTyr-binding forkhead associated (FHA) protein
METQANTQTEESSETDKQQPPLARLVCTDPSLDSSLEDLEIPLKETEQTIGRAETNTVIIDYMRVSRHHARIFPDNGEWVIEDISSTNGLFVSDTPTSHAVLKHGEQISIASIPFRFELEYNNAEPVTDTQPIIVPRSVPKQLNQNPEATTLMQNSPFVGESVDFVKRPSKQYGWYVAITLILLLAGAVLTAVFA